MAKQKFYVVWAGKTPGIYVSWETCKAQVDGFTGAKYKSFKSRPEAENAYSQSYWNSVSPTKQKASIIKNAPYVYPSIAVDAACSGNPGVLEYQGVDTKTGEIVFKPAPINKGTNNLGEFLAIVHAFAYLEKNNLQTPIYTDSRTAMAWVKNKAVKSKLVRDNDTAEVWALVDRALSWLNSHTFRVEIIKWPTEIWGEIPADFGRK